MILKFDLLVNKTENTLEKCNAILLFFANMLYYIEEPNC